MLRVSEIERDFFAKVISDGIQFFIFNRPFSRPRLDPFLPVRYTKPDLTLLNLESCKGNIDWT